MCAIFHGILDELVMLSHQSIGPALSPLYWGKNRSVVQSMCCDQILRVSRHYASRWCAVFIPHLHRGQVGLFSQSRMHTGLNLIRRALPTQMHQEIRASNPLSLAPTRPPPRLYNFTPQPCARVPSAVQTRAQVLAPISLSIPSPSLASTW